MKKIAAQTGNYLKEYMQLQQKSQGFRRAQQTREKTIDVSEFLKAAKDYAGRGMFEKARMETSKARSITESSLWGRFGPGLGVMRLRHILS